MTPDLATWTDQIRAGEPRAVARAVTAIEDHAPQAEVGSTAVQFSEQH